MEAGILFQTIMRGEWQEVVNAYRIKELQKLEITSSGETVLHLAVRLATAEVVLELVGKLRTNAFEILKIKNNEGNTPLHLAAAIGDRKMCDCMATKERLLIKERNNEGETSIFLSAFHGKEDVFSSLDFHFKKVKDNDCSFCTKTKGSDTILHAAISQDHFSLAVEIAESYPDLLNSVNERGLSPLHILACKPHAFRSSSNFEWFDDFIYERLSIGDENKEMQEYQRAHRELLRYESFFRQVTTVSWWLRTNSDEGTGTSPSAINSGTNSQVEELPAGQNTSASKRIRRALIHFGLCFPLSIFSVTKHVLEEIGFMTAKALLWIDSLSTIRKSYIEKLKDKKMMHTNAFRLLNELVKGSSIYQVPPIEANPPQENLTNNGSTTPTTTATVTAVAPTRAQVIAPRQAPEPAWTPAPARPPTLAPPPISSYGQVLVQVPALTPAIARTPALARPPTSAPVWSHAQAPAPVPAMTRAIAPTPAPARAPTQASASGQAHAPVTAQTPAIAPTPAPTPILIAAKMGVTEVMEKILVQFPVASYDLDSDHRNVVLLAAENKQPNVFKLLLNKKSLNNNMFSQLDKEGNSALHLAATFNENQSLHSLHVAFRMRWEVLWYQFVKGSMAPYFYTLQNKEGKTPGEIFSKTHEEVVKSASEWLVKVSESCSVVGALIATIAASTSATFSGNTNGVPNNVSETVFHIFTISSLLAFCFSVVALSLFLAIRTSTFKKRDFTVVPKLVNGLILLWASLASMLISVCSRQYLIIDDQMKPIALGISIGTGVVLIPIAIVFIPLIMALFSNFELIEY